MGPSAGPSTLITNEHMIFIQDFEKLLKSAGPPGDRQARAVGKPWKGGAGRTGTRPALAEGKVYAGGNGGIQGGIRSGRSALIKIESELI